MTDEFNGEDLKQCVSELYNCTDMKVKPRGCYCAKDVRWCVV